MLGGGGGGSGSVYWGAKGGDFRGIVVVFAWVSIQERHLRSYVELYSSLGWNSLVCHAGFLNAFASEKAMSMAFFVLNELLKELEIKPCPVVLAAFSAGSKACMSKVFQIIEKPCESQLNWDKYGLVRNCVSGHVFDSGPVDFTSDFGSRFTLPSTILKRPVPAKVVSWIVKGVSSGLDALYLTRFEAQRAEYWQNLHSSVCMGAPYLILCSEDDSLAPYQTIFTFAEDLRGSGADVKLVKLHGSTHNDHYKHYPIQYRAAIASLFAKAASIFSQRFQQLEEERTRTGSKCDEISELICDLQNAAVNSNQSLRRVATGPSDHFFLPSSVNDSYAASGSSNNEQKESSNLTQNAPGISAHSILGEMLFDICVPKNVEGWDIKFSGSLNGQPYACARKLSPSREIKSIRRSRL
ncbi:uncharacterized protein LOC115737147 isoform X2 [Rhodamnia argentea]|uniref:Uncharacterized protein LOC115737147 isoform X2 n=1 Tax=Rhodamnia argentea TaxID=178133 RepID=A0A8B8NR72_9MYRT|nr:uncharacterized protein LOC115737147 isoform X2 [Rhodamnia argentea]